MDSGDVVLEVGGDAEALRTLVAGKVPDVEVDEILVLLQAAPVVERLAANGALPRLGLLFEWLFLFLMLLGLLFDERKLMRLRGDGPQFHGREPLLPVDPGQSVAQTLRHLGEGDLLQLVVGEEEPHRLPDVRNGGLRHRQKARLRLLDLGDGGQEVGVLAENLKEDTRDADGAVPAGELKVAVHVRIRFAEANHVVEEGRNSHTSHISAVFKGGLISGARS